jgi:hypothetical protein
MNICYNHYETKVNAVARELQLNIRDILGGDDPTGEWSLS